MTGLEPVQVPAAYELVTDRLRRAIHLGTFAPGEQLPTERELAAALGVSRVTLREALRTLAASGYIVTRRGSRGGSTVTEGPGGSGELRAELVRNLDAFDGIMEFREVVEPGAARLAAERADAAQLAGLDAAVDAIRGVASAAEFRRADSAFHAGVAAAAGNPMLAAAVANARELVFTPTDALPFAVLVSSSAEAHARVRDAIAARHPGDAAATMAEHIRATRAELREALGLAAAPGR